LDSDLGLKEAEFRHFESNLGKNAAVVFHDTSAPDAIVRQGVARLDGEGLLKSVHLRTPRGLVLCQYTGRLGRQRIAGTPQTELDEYSAARRQHEKATHRKMERRARELADKAIETVRLFLGARVSEVIGRIYQGIQRLLPVGSGSPLTLQGRSDDHQQNDQGQRASAQDT